MSDTLEWAAYTKPAQEHYMQIYVCVCVCVCVYVFVSVYAYVCVYVNFKNVYLYACM